MDVWMESGWKIHKLVIVESDGVGLFEKLSNALEDDALELAMVLARKLWLRRNSIIFGGAISSPQQLVKVAKESLADFHLASLSFTNGPDVPPHNERQKWGKPPMGAVKIN